MFDHCNLHDLGHGSFLGNTTTMIIFFYLCLAFMVMQSFYIFWSHTHRHTAGTQALKET
uniref:Uncharacterized protein n=1 Tax=Rhizophora mucronata TaxID=61149 RepID=A0A2P2IHT6_RHIMU